jgi:hypothetical protein
VSDFVDDLAWNAIQRQEEEDCDGAGSDNWEIDPENPLEVSQSEYCARG